MALQAFLLGGIRTYDICHSRALDHRDCPGLKMHAIFYSNWNLTKIPTSTDHLATNLVPTKIILKRNFRWKSNNIVVYFNAFELISILWIIWDNVYFSTDFQTPPSKLFDFQNKMISIFYDDQKWKLWFRIFTHDRQDIWPLGEKTEGKCYREELTYIMV